jgi:hypothetical protein
VGYWYCCPGIYRNLHTGVDVGNQGRPKGVEALRSAACEESVKPSLGIILQRIILRVSPKKDDHRNTRCVFN